MMIDVKITEEQIDLAVELDQAFGSLLEFPPYFMRQVDAIDRDDPAALGKFIALAILELARRDDIAWAAARWFELFGKLPEFDLFNHDIMPS